MAPALKKELAPGVNLASRPVRWTKAHAASLRAPIPDLYDLEPPARNADRVAALAPGPYYITWLGPMYTRGGKVDPKALAKVIGTYRPLTPPGNIKNSTKTTDWVAALNTQMPWTQAVAYHCPGRGRRVGVAERHAALR